MCRNGGLEPRWNEKFYLNLTPYINKIEFIIWDYDFMLNDDYNCDGALSLSEVPEDYRIHNIPLIYEEKNVGELVIMTNYTSSN